MKVLISIINFRNQNQLVRIETRIYPTTPTITIRYSSVVQFIVLDSLSLDHKEGTKRGHVALSVSKKPIRKEDSIHSIRTQVANLQAATISKLIRPIKYSYDPYLFSGRLV